MRLESLRARVKAGEHFDYLLFYGHSPPADGEISAACFSQWYGAGFEVEGVRHVTAEHYMMAGKARLFEDPEMLARILDAPGPSEAKRLGRQVRGFDEARWKAARFEIVVNGNLAKFEQNPELGRFLLETGERVLVEAAPRDRIWGIGMGRKNPAARDPLAWRGQNLLGFALMEVREALREAAAMSA